MPKQLLTELSIRTLKAPESGQVDYWDTKTPGFGVRVGTNRKTFIAKVNNRRHSLGLFGSVTLQEARKKALSLKAEDDTPPASKLTFGEAYERFKTEHIEKKKERTQYDYKRVLERYFLPELQTTPLTKISYGTVAKITDQLIGTPSEQAHALSVARTFFKWCTRPPRRYIPFSPLEGLQITTGKSRKRVLTNNELVQVWLAADAQGYPHGNVIKLLILTGQRKSEIGALSRPWIDQLERTITLPAHICKNNTEHTFPYGEMAAAVLDTAPRRNSTDYLFPSRYEDDRPFSGWSKFKKELNDGCAHWTLHDLRRTFATKLAELRVPPHIIERLLNHKLGSITKHTDSIVTAVASVYNRFAYLEEMREAIEKWERFLSELVTKAAAQAKAA